MRQVNKQHVVVMVSIKKVSLLLIQYIQNIMSRHMFDTIRLNMLHITATYLLHTTTKQICCTRPSPQFIYKSIYKLLGGPWLFYHSITYYIPSLYVVTFFIMIVNIEHYQFLHRCVNNEYLNVNRLHYITLCYITYTVTNALKTKPTPKQASCCLLDTSKILRAKYFVTQ